MKARSWSKPHTIQSACRMLSADHLNIDGPPFPVKCARKFRSALDGEVTYRYVCVCVNTHQMGRLGGRGRGSLTHSVFNARYPDV